MFNACYLLDLFSNSAQRASAGAVRIHLGVFRGIDRRVWSRVVIQVMVSHPLDHDVDYVHRGAEASLLVKHHKKLQKLRGEPEEGFLIPVLSNSNWHP